MSPARLLAVLLLCSVAHHAHAQKKQVNCAAQKILLDAAVDNMTMMMSEWETGYASLQEVEDEYCKPFPDWFKVFNGYKACLKSFPRTLFAFVGTNIKKVYREFCQTEEKKVIAFNHLTCFNPGNKPFFLDIDHRIKNFADYISKLPNVDDVIPGFCCGYLNITKGMDRELEEECQRQQKPGSGKFIMNIVRALFNDAVDIMCGKYQKPEDCREPKLVGILDEMITQSRNITSFPFKSPVLPVLQVLHRMDGKVNID